MRTQDVGHAGVRLRRPEAEHGGDVGTERYEGEVGEVEDAGESDLQVQSEYQDAQSASVPSVMRKTWWWVSPASLSSSEMRSMSVMDSTLHLALTRCPRERG